MDRDAVLTSIYDISDICGINDAKLPAGGQKRNYIQPVWTRLDSTDL